MNDPNRLMKWLLVIGLVVLAMVILYPPSKKLKGGIDLVGGTSLLYEIDTTGLERGQIGGLSSKVMEILKERVDPKGQLNLEWRPVGNTRLEIRMPRPPKEALARRGAFNRALKQVEALNIRRKEVELALHAPAAERDAALTALVRGIPERGPLISAVSDASDARAAVPDDADPGVRETASKTYEEALDKLLDTSMPIIRLTDILALGQGNKRESALVKLMESFPAYDAEETGNLLTRAVEAHDEWAVDKAELEDPSDLKRRIRGAGVLEFRILADHDPSLPSSTKDQNPTLCQPISKYTEQLAKFGPRHQAGDVFVWFPIDNVVSFMRLDDESQVEEEKDNPVQPIVEEYAGRYYALMHDGADYKMLQRKGKANWTLRKVYPDRHPLTGENTVNFTLDWRGGKLFGELTGENVDRRMCIMLDDTAMSSATIIERIGERCQITGGFTQEKVSNLVRILDAGSLPARLKEPPLMEKTIGPSLGETNRTRGMQAAIGGGIVVGLFVLVYYGIAAGGMANIALAMNLLFVLSAMALMQATFTLPGIAGLILTVGMAIDANVLIFERIREERSRGMVFKKAMNVGYDKAFSTIMDANLTTLITCVILGFVGSQEVKGFALVLGLGITTSMFTALFVTRLVFNTFIFKGWLKDLSMRRIIGVPTVDWLALRRFFWPISAVCAAAGASLFVGLATTNKEAVFDIEFLGGTSVQIDLKPGEDLTDDEVRQLITGAGQADTESAVGWLQKAAERLESATIGDGEVPTQFTLTSADLTGKQLGVLMRQSLGNNLERDGITATGNTAVFDGKPGQEDRPGLDRAGFEQAVTAAAKAASAAAARLRGARVQTVSEISSGTEEQKGRSFEVVTVETNRALVQTAILTTMGNRLSVQQAIGFAAIRDENLTKESFFLVEAEDHYLSEVIGGEAAFDVREFRGGVAVHVVLDAPEGPLTVEELEKRLREVGLQSEFEQYRTHDAAVYALGSATPLGDDRTGYKEFAILASDDALRYQDDEVQWEEQLAKPQLAQIEAALGREKSLSKVINFEPQIAGQTQSRAIFAIVLALGAIVAYVWLRFGSKEFGLAAIVALVHDVSITLGLVALSHFVFNNFLAKGLLIEEFRIDLSMIAALLTVIGYSLNDTIVVFDRIRENRGKSGALAAGVINTSINQTLSRTLLTSFTTFLVVAILYWFGGKGVHGFAFALLIGVIVGTYSSIGIATPLLYREQLLKKVVAVIVALGMIGMVFALAGHPTVRWVLSGLILVGLAVVLLRIAGPRGLPATGRAARA